MKGQFLHVGFKWVGPPKTAELKPVFSKAVDWVRYAPNCWILYTTSSARVWKERVKPHLGDEDSVLIVKLDPSERNGLLPRWVWDWFKKPRTK